MVTSYDFGHRLIRLSYKSENCSRNKRDNISCNTLNQTIKIIHGQTNASQQYQCMVEFTLNYQCSILALLALLVLLT